MSYYRDTESRSDPRGPGLAAHPNARSGKMKVIVNDRLADGRIKRYTLDPNDPDSWNRHWRGEYIPTAGKKRYYKGQKEDFTRYVDPANYTNFKSPPELPMPVYVPVSFTERYKVIIAWAALALIVSLFLGVVVQLKEHPRSPGEAARSNVAQWVWGINEYLRSLFSRTG
ncbi:hypothetical protein M409DRAFT_22701 [Zasmidium cellare ATCC 36951]|uniref:Uncharacterized protein n=1 Tax=Zasmidium cellare ATCC 36951 TaxID=1080233 RepID=A0A6A6CJ61_ZASCE|nr:uncharacterized protein M409DRAFT_22701 [Zasmidium cellare ATCC 36951]KAF2167274.1 hypothetical protein M409DRAFT_22701 [Zasmidium cellare ATCC 36951]